MDIKERKAKLEEARKILKEEFAGIDGPIDEVIDHVYSWYCFPEGQIRPTVVNLVGMTGVGKTSLIERLFAILDMENLYYKFDMGYYANENENLKHELSKKVRIYNEAPVCFAFDEFQLGRSIDDNGDEIDRGNFRPIWDLLDSGKINLIEPNFGVESLYTLMLKLERCVENGVRSKGLEIVRGDKYFKELFGNDGYDDPSEEDDVEKKLSMIPNSYFYYIQQCAPNRFVGHGELRQYLSMLKNEDSVIEFLRETVEVGAKPKIYDFSNSIIFVIANIDEAFVSTRDMDPDIDADDMHKQSLDITLFDIKNSLRKRFRAEQIARLGNNYVIYPTFNSDSYRQLIDMELKKKSDAVKNKFAIDVVFDRSVKKLIYNEGVFPTQGTRPVFTTINYIIGSFIGRVLSDMGMNDLFGRVSSWEWRFHKGKTKVLLKDADGRKVEEMVYTPKIKVDSLRKTKLNDEQALVSVHEAGHAVVSAALLGLVPSKIMSSSAGGSEGFNLISWSKLKGRDYAIDMASVYLAGIEAERMIFGAENCTSEGSEGDLESATSLITKMVQESGVYDPAVKRNNPHNERTDSIQDHDHSTAIKVDTILKSAKGKAIATLKRHEKVLMALSLELFRKPVLYKKRVAAIFKENGLTTDTKEGFYKDKLLGYETHK